MKTSQSLFAAAVAALVVGCSPTTSTPQGGTASNSGTQAANQALDPNAPPKSTPKSEALKILPGAAGPGRSAGGEAAAGGGGGQQGGGGMGRGGGLAFLLRNDQIKSELKLTEEQVKKLEAAAPQGMRDMSQEDRQKAITKFEEEAKKTLTPEQSQRVKEIQYQLQGPRAFLSEDVQKALSLSKDQVAKLEEALNPPRPEAGQAPGPAGGQGFDRDAFMKAREEANKKALAILTAEQKAKWEKMRGKKFELQMPQGGPGGPGAAGGGQSG